MSRSQVLKFWNMVFSVVFNSVYGLVWRSVSNRFNRVASAGSDGSISRYAAQVAMFARAAMSSDVVVAAMARPEQLQALIDQVQQMNLMIAAHQQELVALRAAQASASRSCAPT